MGADEYDKFADSYNSENSSSLLNEYYERPAMLALAGDVVGRRILDAGCGSGPLSAALRERGAIMSGFDGSPAMIELARRRLGDQVPLHVADLASSLPFADDAFDDVMASLVLHYLEDWTGPLGELRRLIKPGGRLIVSVPHPLVRVFTNPDEDYFATRRYTEEYDLAGKEVVLEHWHRPLHAMTDAFTGSGFEVAVISEPAPSSDTPSDLLPPRIRNGLTTSFLAFIFFVLRVH
ncbi:class I SAM-dependent methyltransferase [Leifsonia sp. NPDC014704]|uniref:class I SAM-dependent methyltransferase n=1 Tax=Leifsonia sp. NPDC014704 TaxID=3364123 RepID=UPI0036F4A934